MFTGIVQGIAHVAVITDRPGLRSFELAFPPGFDAGLEIGASVACDGVCLTVTARPAPDRACFDVMQQSLGLTTLAGLAVGSALNVERAARDGAEIGGHTLSGHVDCLGSLLAIRRPENNHVLRIGVPASHMRYVFAKGYIAINGASHFPGGATFPRSVRMYTMFRIERIDDVVAIMRGEGMNATVSSIHVNGWFGSYDKLSMSREVLRDLYGVDLDADRERFIYAGDSPNDAPMFAHFPNAVGVANVRDFVGRMDALPAYVTQARSGDGFAELAELLIRLRAT